MTIDFSGIKTANAIADVVGRYVDLKRQGTEYAARCPFHNERTPSFYVVPKKEKAFCMGCGWQGDVVDFIIEIERFSDDAGDWQTTPGWRSAQRKAAEFLGSKSLPKDRPAPPPLPPDVSDDWQPLIPTKEAAQEVVAGGWRVFNPKSGKTPQLKPTASWAYHDGKDRLLGFVLRCQFDDGRKWTPTITWCQHATTGERRWCMRPFGKPRPIYGLDRLAARPEAPVLLVEGEKCADAAQRALPGFVVVSWPGGTNGAAHVDFQPLFGRAVTAWPDADEGGVEVMVWILTGLNAAGSGALRILDVTGLPKGYDVADAVDAGMDRAALVAFCKARVRAWSPAEVPPDPEGGVVAAEPAGETSEAPREGFTPDAAGSAASPQDTAPDAPTATAAINGTVVDLPPVGGDAYSQLTTWSGLGLSLSEKGTPVANLDNAARILERHPDVVGRFWYDEFLGRILTSWNARGEPVEWSDTDDVRLGLWLQRKLGIGRMAVGTARDAVTAVAMAHRRNECQEWLRALRWDGRDRLRLLLPIGFGADATPYTEAVGRCFLVGMVARALQPGCKVDSMPVFEGPQGKGKSTALQVLVGERWFGEASESVLSKDFFQALQGKLLIEIGEMDTFGRAEVSAVKRVITCRVDRFRAPYGRRAEDHPRSSVLAGTVNGNEYLRDSTGGRRFWPVTCGALDLGWIARWREQLFAEAVARFNQRESWWDVPGDDAEHEQEQRRVRDEWETVIAEWLVLKTGGETTVAEVLKGALGLEAEAWDKSSQMRVASALTALGWVNAGNVRRGSRVVKVWRDPKSLQVAT